MAEAVFFRLLSEEVEDKPSALEVQIAALNDGNATEGMFSIAQRAFSIIPNTPFAYWVSTNVLNLFADLPVLESDVRFARLGLTTLDDTRFIRLFWEILATNHNEIWYTFAKGGSFSTYFADIYLMLDWEENGKRLRTYLTNERHEVPSRRIRSEELYLRPGLTWPRRTNGFSVRAMPACCIFADKGPAAFVADDDHGNLLALIAIMNSDIFGYLVRLQLARTELAQSYEVGLIQSTPVPNRLDDRLALLSRNAHDLQRERFLTDETTHVFHLPALSNVIVASLQTASLALAGRETERAQQFAVVQAQIDEIVFDLYGLSDEDRQLVMHQMGTTVTAEDGIAEEDELEEDAEDTSPEDLPAQVMNLLMWCVGVAFGRWDVRKALDQSLFPSLPEPFDPLPCCAPGALMNANGLPAERDDVPDDYPLPIAWDGILVDDSAQEANPYSLDIVARVRGVITLLWGEDQAEGIEAEICRVMGYRALRSIFRDARQGMFAFHIKRYSKSRRKAPIYWLLQTGARSPNYGMWLYYPRIDDKTLFIAEDIAYKKIQRETFRLTELKQGLDGLDRAARKQRDPDIAVQTRLVDEVTDFHSRLRQLANLRLPPDHNDGVLISMAPLHELVPWRETAAMWTKLIRGEYIWSTMSQRMNARGFITGKG